MLPQYVRGDVIRSWRESLGLTRLQTAPLLGVSKKTLERYENPLSREREIEQYEANYDDIRQKDNKRRREIYAADPEPIRVQSRRWGRTHAATGKRAIKAREWRSKNRHRSNFYSHIRRARKLAARGTCSAAQAALRIEVYGGICAYCKKAPHAHLDHVIPLVRGGSNWPSNFRPSCQRCNQSKGSKLLSEWEGPQ